MPAWCCGPSRRATVCSAVSLGYAVLLGALATLIVAIAVAVVIAAVRSKK